MDYSSIVHIISVSSVGAPETSSIFGRLDSWSAVVTIIISPASTTTVSFIEQRGPERSTKTVLSTWGAYLVYQTKCIALFKAIDLFGTYSSYFKKYHTCYRMIPSKFLIDRRLHHFWHQDHSNIFHSSDIWQYFSWSRRNCEKSPENHQFVVVVHSSASNRIYAVRHGTDVLEHGARNYSTGTNHFGLHPQETGSKSNAKREEQNMVGSTSHRKLWGFEGAGVAPRLV